MLISFKNQNRKCSAEKGISRLKRIQRPPGDTDEARTDKAALRPGNLKVAPGKGMAKNTYRREIKKRGGDKFAENREPIKTVFETRKRAPLFRVKANHSEQSSWCPRDVPLFRLCNCGKIPSVCSYDKTHQWKANTAGNKEKI